MVVSDTLTPITSRINSLAFSRQTSWPSTKTLSLSSGDNLLPVKALANSIRLSIVTCPKMEVKVFFYDDPLAGPQARPQKPGGCAPVPFGQSLAQNRINVCVCVGSVTHPSVGCTS